VQNDRKLLPFDIVDKEGKPIVNVQVNGQSKQFSPEEISAMILGKMKETAEVMGQPVLALFLVPHICAHLYN